MRKGKICFITGTRADYGLMRHVLEKISKEFELSLIVTGMHLSPEFGYTIDEIERDGFKIAQKVDMLLAGDTGGAMAKSLGLAITGITQALENIKPDMALVVGDRGETLAGAMAGAFLNIPVAHIHGGDQGDDGAHIDDSIRHSVTKFAHIHLAATKLSAERLLKMGEEQWRIHIVGAPGLDDIYLQDFYSKREIEEKYGLNLSKPLILVIQHPVLTQLDKAEEQMRGTLEALKEIDEQTILIYPNADAGGREMIKVIQEYEDCKFLKTYRNLPRKDYLSLMKYANVMVGNSSSGIIEAPAFKLPAVNIGIRNSVRENAGNKIFVGHNRDEIIGAIRKALFDEGFRQSIGRCKSPYGDGSAAKRIVKVLKESCSLDKWVLLKKSLGY